MNNSVKLAEKQTDARDIEKEILVKFKPGVAENEIAKLTSELGLQQIKTIPALRVRVFKITSNKSRDEVIDACEKQPFMEYAEPNQTYKAQK